MIDLNADETDLLGWLSQADYSQYGECYGPALDKLCELGLAQIHEHRTVSLTDEGRELAAKLSKYDHY